VRTRAMTVGPVELAIAEAGEGGRPILLLHGFTGAKEDFSEWLDPLAVRGWHAVAPDHRGHGASSKPGKVGDYSFALLAGDSVALADALGWGRFALLGHSMGGYVAQRIAFADSGRLSGLILQDTGHGPIDIDASQAALAIKIATESGIDALADARARHTSPLDTPAHQRLLRERAGYAEFDDRKFRATSPWLYAAMVPELMSGPDTLGDLSAMDPVPPTLVIVGEQDEPFLGSAQRIAGVIAGSRLAVIPGAGHSPQFENPAAWWEAMTSFLDALA